MNLKAREIGCEDTYFITPNGLDAENENGIHSTTAEDLARILRYCIMESPKKEDFLAITRMPSYTFWNYSKTQVYQCTNHNAFLGMMDGALTGKTGFTGNAGYCYVGYSFIISSSNVLMVNLLFSRIAYVGGLPSFGIDTEPGFRIVISPTFSARSTWVCPCMKMSPGFSGGRLFSL